MGYKKKYWQEKLADKKSLPKNLNWKRGSPVIMQLLKWRYSFK